MKDKKESQKNSIVLQFLKLENDLFKILNDFPFEGNNKKAYSITLANLITNIGNLLDSTFRFFSPRERKCTKSIKKKDSFNINDFKIIFNKKYDISNQNILLYVTHPEILKPFEGWSHNQKLKGGGVYNSLKHDRIKHLQLATFDNVINILGALFVFINCVPDMTKVLVRYDVLHLGSGNIDYIIPKLCDKKRTKYATNNGEALGEHTIISESQLFAMPIGKTRFPENVDDLNPMYYEGREKLSRFLGRVTGY